MRTDLLMRLSRCAAALTLLAAGTADVQAAPVTLINATTGLVVFGGEANNGLVPSGGYFDYTDVAAAELVMTMPCAQNSSVTSPRIDPAP